MNFLKRKESIGILYSMSTPVASKQHRSSLRERLRAHKTVPSLVHSFLYSIDFIHEFHLQIINFV